MITADRIEATEKLIRPYIRRTPVIETRGKDFGLDDAELIFKLELCQHAGSFKVRGAFSNLLSRTVPPVGVVAASGGNHGVAVAYASAQLGIPAKIFVPSIASPSKIDSIRRFGADLVVGGDRYADALAASQEYARTSGALQLHAYDQIETLLGQGSLGLEFERQVDRLDTVLVAVGGGGLIGGVAAWFAGRAAQGTIKVIGVEPASAPTLTYALRVGHPVDAPAEGIAADSLAPRQVGQLMFPIAQKSVDRVVLVSDESIAQAQQTLWTGMRIAPEPGGAAAFAALLSKQYVPQPGEHVGVIVCGANTTAVQFDRS